MFLWFYFFIYPNENPNEIEFLFVKRDIGRNLQHTAVKKKMQ